jgi:hypothetical protein
MAVAKAGREVCNTNLLHGVAVSQGEESKVLRTEIN